MIAGRLFLLLLATNSACSLGAQSNAAERSAALADSSRPDPLTTDPIRRRFEDWLLACDNGRVCRAQPAEAGGALLIRRDPGPGGAIIVVLDGAEPLEGMVPNPASIRIVGAPSASEVHWQVDRETESARLEGEAALRFVRTLARGTSLEYVASGETVSVPLTGIGEALAAMDAAQGHGGGEAAFVSVGSRPSSELPSAPALPVIAAAPPAPPLPAGFAARVRRANAAALAECGRQDLRGLDEAHPLTDEDALVILECSHGLTHTLYLLLRVPRDAPGRAQPVTLDWVKEAGDSEEYTPGYYTGIVWDPQTRSLTSETWSCAHLCGENVTWVFDGREFRLASQSFYRGGSAELLDLYRAEVRTRR